MLVVASPSPLPGHTQIPSGWASGNSQCRFLCNLCEVRLVWGLKSDPHTRGAADSGGTSWHRGMLAWGSTALCSIYPSVWVCGAGGCSVSPPCSQTLSGVLSLNSLVLVRENKVRNDLCRHLGNITLKYLRPCRRNQESYYSSGSQSVFPRAFSK